MPPNGLALAGEAEDGHVEGRRERALTVGRSRLVVVGALFALGYLMVGARLVDVAMVREGFEPPFRRAVAVHAQLSRRDIVDRNGVLLATNLPTASLYANPTKILDAEEAASMLADALPGISRAELLSKLRSPREFVWIKRNLTPREQVAINRLGVPGLAFQREERRVYPLGPLFAHVVGFTDIDNRGLAGVEKAFDDALGPPPPGRAEPLRLSLDTRFQHVLRDELARGMAAFRAAGAAGVVLDAADGETIAMVSLPDFSPNRPEAGDGAARFNRATLGAYEMGSTFKVFTTAMALDLGVVTLSDRYDVSEPIRAARFTIRDYKPEKGWLTVPQILIRSSNIGAAKMALDVGAASQREFLARLGLLQPANIELPEVATPMFPVRWREISAMTIAYGHGVAVSPLQVASAIAAVVDGGVYKPPTLLPRSPGESPQGWRAMSMQTSSQMRELMRLVVAEGTGAKAAVPGYRIGGKTGTADKVGRDGYQSESRVSSFVAAFPIDAPRYVVFVMFDDPQGTAETFNFATGGWTAAPVAGRVIARIGPLAGIAPDDATGGDPKPGPLVTIAGREGVGVAF